MQHGLTLISNWLRLHQRRAQPKVRLICFPHAAGTPTFYQAWSKRLPDWIEVVSVHYPGRESRSAEPLVGEMTPLVAHIRDAMLPLLDLPFAMFGHSLGAAVAHEVTRQLEALHLVPIRLYVSGRRAPQFERMTTRYLHDDERLWKDVCRLGGTPEQLLNNATVRDVMLPILRNDYRLSETYLPKHTTPLRCPITAFVGDQDEEVTAEHAAGWSAFSATGFDLQVMSGGHFFLIRQWAELLSRLVQGLGALQADVEHTAATVSQRP
jgi:pyochelin biosynthesis protein PchC